MCVQFREHDNNHKENNWSSHGKAQLNISGLHGTTMIKRKESEKS